MITLRLARLDERRKIYDWMASSDLTSWFLGAPDFPEHPVPSWDEFLPCFEDFYFDEAQKEKGGTFIIEEDAEELGSISYSNFHLEPGKSELDIWMKEQAACGKGAGPRAIKALVSKLHSGLGVKEFLIRPGERNQRAIRAYEKAGFQKVPAQKKEEVLRAFLLPEYWDEYAPGDYGPEATGVMTLVL